MQPKRGPQSRRQTGSVLLIVLLLMVLLSLLGVTLLTVAQTEHTMATNGVWSEGALMAAEAGVNQGLNQLSADSDRSTRDFGPTPIGQYQYWSGPKSGKAQPAFKGKTVHSGYSLAVGTGYNSSGFAYFNKYQINATGTGPQNAQREVEVQAEYGPVAQ
jgi:hypothetical protein